MTPNLQKPQRDYIAAVSYRDALRENRYNVPTTPTMIQEAEQFAQNAAKVLSGWAYTHLKQRDQQTADNFRRLAFLGGFERAAEAALDLEVR